MKCPVDGTVLTIADRAGVEIDYCPQCRGVWLDRGELDKILDRAGREQEAAMSRAPRRDDERRYDDDRRRHDDERHRGKRRDSWWSDIFDF